MSDTKNIFVKSWAHALFTLVVIWLICGGVIASQWGEIKFNDKNNDGVVNPLSGELSFHESSKWQDSPQSKGILSAGAVVGGILTLALGYTYHKTHWKKAETPKQ